MFDTVGIIGAGLLGSSVAAATKARGVAKTTLVSDISETNLAVCVAAGFADGVAATLSDLAAHADLVVLATPADTVAGIVENLAPHLKPGALVTDVASVKAHIARIAHAAMPPGRRFVGAHPMAGSERGGAENARADLFAGRACFVTPLPGRTDESAAARVADYWRALGATVVFAAPDAHDEIVAAISHLPHAVAVALALTLSEGADTRACAGPGLRDTTRIAAGNPDIWRAILLENRHEIIGAIRRFEERLGSLRETLEANDGEKLHRMLSRAREWRADFPA